jgi:hypothetical protein
MCTLLLQPITHLWSGQPLHRDLVRLGIHHTGPWEGREKWALSPSRPWASERGRKDKLSSSSSSTACVTAVRRIRGIDDLTASTTPLIDLFQRTPDTEHVRSVQSLLPSTAAWSSRYSHYAHRSRTRARTCCDIRGRHRYTRFARVGHAEHACRRNWPIPASFWN